MLLLAKNMILLDYTFKKKVIFQRTFKSREPLFWWHRPNRLLFNFTSANDAHAWKKCYSHTYFVFKGLLLTWIAVFWKAETISFNYRFPIGIQWPVEEMFMWTGADWLTNYGFNLGLPRWRHSWPQVWSYKFHSLPKYTRCACT